VLEAGLSSADPQVKHMSLEFAPGWNVQKSSYVAKFGPYQQQLNLLTSAELKTALRIAMLLYREGVIGDMMAAANSTAGDRVVVEQGSHQEEAIMDQPARNDVKAFDMVKNKTLHFTLRHYKAGGPANGFAFHCYLSRNTRRQWGVTSISYFKKNAGLQMGQTGARDFMSMLAKRFVLAHGYEED
jgi:hypothetical protein